MKKTASAHWQGGIKDGKGTMSTESGALNKTPYGFNTRFEDKPGSNPEELLGAAHAGCFSMALSKELGDAGMTAESIETHAEVTLEKKTAVLPSLPCTCPCARKSPGRTAQPSKRP